MLIEPKTVRNWEEPIVIVSAGANATTECAPSLSEDDDTRFLRFFRCNSSEIRVTDCYFDARAMCNVRCDTFEDRRRLFAAAQCSNGMKIQHEYNVINKQTLVYIYSELCQ